MAYTIFDYTYDNVKSNGGSDDDARNAAWAAYDSANKNTRDKQWGTYDVGGEAHDNQGNSIRDKWNNTDWERQQQIQKELREKAKAKEKGAEELSENEKSSGFLDYLNTPEQQQEYAEAQGLNAGGKAFVDDTNSAGIKGGQRNRDIYAQMVENWDAGRSAFDRGDGKGISVQSGDSKDQATTGQISDPWNHNYNQINNINDLRHAYLGNALGENTFKNYDKWNQDSILDENDEAISGIKNQNYREYVDSLYGRNKAANINDLSKNTNDLYSELWKEYDDMAKQHSAEGGYDYADKHFNDLYILNNDAKNYALMSDIAKKAGFDNIDDVYNLDKGTDRYDKFMRQMLGGEDTGAGNTVNYDNLSEDEQRRRAGQRFEGQDILEKMYGITQAERNSGKSADEILANEDTKTGKGKQFNGNIQMNSNVFNNKQGDYSGEGSVADFIAKSSAEPTDLGEALQSGDLKKLMGGNTYSLNNAASKLADAWTSPYDKSTKSSLQDNAMRLLAKNASDSDTLKELSDISKNGKYSDLEELIGSDQVNSDKDLATGLINTYANLADLAKYGDKNWNKGSVEDQNQNIAALQQFMNYTDPNSQGDDSRNSYNLIANGLMRNPSTGDSKLDISQLPDLYTLDVDKWSNLAKKIGDNKTSPFNNELAMRALASGGLRSI